jgi:F-type H+-transporting ATPase subunit epsilon
MNLEIVTPDRLAWKGTVVHVKVPGSVGEFGVLEKHANLLGVTRPGRLTLETEGEHSTRILGAGFAEVGPEGLTLLVDSCEEVGSYDPVQAAKDLEEAQASLKAADPMTRDFEHARNSVDLAQARLES